MPAAAAQRFSLKGKQPIDKISMRNLVTITSMLLVGAAILLTAHESSSANPRSLSGVVQTGGTTSSQPLPNVRHVVRGDTYSPRSGGRGDHRRLRSVYHS